MTESSLIHVLAAVTPAALSRYRTVLSQDAQIKLSLVTHDHDARAFLTQSQQCADVLVLDSALCDAYALINELRQSYPRLMILLVDAEADFSTAGRADDVTTQPFEDGDLVRRIKRLAQERQLETLRADMLPPVRSIAKDLRRAGSSHAKQSAVVNAIAEMGYDYVAFYQLLPTSPPSLSLASQVGPPQLGDMAPASVPVGNTLLGWVAESGQSRVVGLGDTPNHLFIERGLLASGACIPVGKSLHFGVLFVCRAEPRAISEHHVKLLELIGAQLANALARDQN